MSTTKKGNAFEKRSCEIIHKAILEGQLGIYSDQCRVYQKKAYYGHLRKKEIIFDLTIEVWPPAAQNYTLLFIIECKSYSNHKVPVDDIEEFYTKTTQIMGMSKRIFITDSTFQESSYSTAESLGIMLIQVNYDESYKILLHSIFRSKRLLSKQTKKNKLETWDDIITNFLTDLFNRHAKVKGLKALSSSEISRKAKDLIQLFKPSILSSCGSVPLDEFITFLETEFSLLVDYSTTLHLDKNGNKILGYYDQSSTTIHIDSSLYGTSRFAFVFAHEIGHFILHRDLQINSQLYNSFKDSEYNFKIDSYELKNEKHWIEWQANKFAACLILPENSLIARLAEYQMRLGIRNVGTIYYDDQSTNRLLFHQIVSYLAYFFGVSSVNVKYRLNDLGVITYANKKPIHWTNFYEELSSS